MAEFKDETFAMTELFQSSDIFKVNSDFENLPIEPEICELQKEHSINMGEFGVDDDTVTDSNLDKDYKIGLACLPNQSKEFSSRKGGQFNLMVAGQVGTGKTTFINTLFHSELLEKSTEFSKSFLEFKKFELYEDKFPLKLTIIETSGFGKGIDNDGSWIPIQNYIDDQFRAYLFQSQQPNRTCRYDSRVHCCIYFLPNNFKSVKALDIETMKSLSKRVNLIPVIGRSDCLSSEELSKYQKAVQWLLKAHDIKPCEFLNDEALVDQIQNQVPYSLIGGNDIYTNNLGEPVRCRKYEWGTVEIENDDMSDFNVVRDLIIRNHMLDFILSTETNYEKFRLSFLTKAVETKKIDDDKVDTKTIRFADEPPVNNLDGLQQLKIYQNLKFQSFIDARKDDILEYKRESLRRSLNNVVLQQEQKFKEWKKTLVVQQGYLNEDLENSHQKMMQLHETVSSLEEGFGLTNPSLKRVELSETYRGMDKELGFSW